MATCTLGLDFGTNSVRALVVDTADGREVGTGVFEYERGDAGVLLSSDLNLARQHPAEYVKGTELAVKAALDAAREAVSDLSAEDVVGIGVDATGSTPVPVGADCVPLALGDHFADDLDAMAWLWKDHTALAEADEITRLAAAERPRYLAKCGGAYSCEWFFSKVLHCLRARPKVFDAAATWVEESDLIPAMLSGVSDPANIVRNVCAAGHKAMYNPEWGGLPDAEFLAMLDPKMGELRARLYERAHTIAEKAGGLSRAWAAKLGLREGTPVAVGALDAHMGAVGSGVAPGTLVKILGTSGCDMVVAPLEREVADIPGICGIVPESILPGHHGLEAGQAAVGDVFNWWVKVVKPGGGMSHEELTAEAERLSPGESGLLALDWNNGNRNVLADQLVTGLLVGSTLHSSPAEIYRALIEATAFGALTIIRRFEGYGVAVGDVVTGGGIAEKNAMLMQIYADVTGRPWRLAGSAQACALGAAVSGAVAAGVYPDFQAAQAKMCRPGTVSYEPRAEAQAVYAELYRLYMQLHDAFGTEEYSGSLHNVMKRLIELRTAARGG